MLQFNIKYTILHNFIYFLESSQFSRDQYRKMLRMGIICFILRDIKLISIQTLYYFSEQQNCVPVNLIRNIVSSSDIWESFAGKAKCLFKPFFLEWERDSNLWLLKSYTIFTLKYLWPSTLYLFHILPVSFKQTKYNRFWLEWFLYGSCIYSVIRWSSIDRDISR